jgi:type IV pilus assembly protein PilF
MDRNHSAPAVRGALCLVLGLAALAGCASSGEPKLARVSEEQERKAVAHYNLGVHHLAEGSTALAIRELQAAVAANPNDPWIHLALAEGYRRKAKIAEAESHLMRSLEVSPEFHNARLTLSALYIQTGRFEQAVVEAQRLVDDPTFPAPWQALTNLGYAQFRLGKLGEARATLQLALEYRAYYWPAILDLAILEAEAGHKLEAVERFKKVLTYDPGPLVVAEVNFRLAEVYVSLGRRKDALAHLDQSVAARPGSSWAKKSVEYQKLLK